MESESTAPATSIGVALSGGGHRAALFGLGVLSYLVDASKNREVTSIASVSGGSLTNGVVAQSKSFPTCSAAEFDEIGNRLTRQLAGRGTLWAVWSTWLYLVVLFSVLGAAVAIWWLATDLWVRAVLFVVALLVFGLVASFRGAVCGRAFARTLFSPGGKTTRLADIAGDDLDHVFCSTDLHAGEHVYFSGRFVCSYRFGFGRPGDVRLHTVVQASAAYPGGFPPRWLKTKPHGFQEPQDPGARKVRRMSLVDGGVYDNMADQWGEGVAGRNDRWVSLAPGLRAPDELIVVNSSAPMRFGRVGQLRLPLVGEALTLLRDINVLYDNTTTPRRRLLYQTFVAATRSGQGLRGAVLQISQSPFDIPSSFARPGADDAPAQRARRVLEELGATETDWKQITDDNSAVKTTLSRIPSPAAERLVRHGYVLAMANLHVVLDYPLLPVPPTSRFAPVP
jgi:predicted acylesterase/phospholipase RssA